LLTDPTARKMWVNAFGGDSQSVSGTAFLRGLEVQLASELRQPDPRFVSTLLLACIQFQRAPEGPGSGLGEAGLAQTQVEDCVGWDAECARQEALRTKARMVTRDRTASYVEVAAAQQQMYDAEDGREDAREARDAALLTAADQAIITVQAFDAVTQQGGPQWVRVGEVQQGQVIRHRRDLANVAAVKRAAEAEDRRAAQLKVKAELAEANMKSFESFLATEKGSGAKKAQSKDDAFWANRSKGIKMYSGGLTSITTKQRTEAAAARVDSHF
jgi:hypothetical protein